MDKYDKENILIIKHKKIFFFFLQTKMRFVKGIVILWTIVFISVFNDNLNKCDAFESGSLPQYQRSEILYNLAELYASNLTINLNCKNDLKLVVDGINNDEMWAMKCE